MSTEDYVAYAVFTLLATGLFFVLLVAFGVSGGLGRVLNLARG